MKYLTFSDDLSLVTELVKFVSQLIKMSSRPTQPRPDQTHCIFSVRPGFWFLWEKKWEETAKFLFSKEKVTG